MKKSRKLTAALTTGVMAMSLAVPAFATSYPALEVASTDLTLVINGKTIETNEKIGQPFITSDGRAMIPLRVVGDELHYGTYWDNEGNVMVTSADDSVNVQMKIGEKAYTANGEAGTFGTAPVLWNDRTYLPARDFAEIYGEIVWDNATRTVSLTMDEAQPPSTEVESGDWSFKIGPGNTPETQDKLYVVATNEKTGETALLSGAEKEFGNMFSPEYGPYYNYYVGKSKIIDGRVYVTVGRGGAMGLNMVDIFAGPELADLAQGGELIHIGGGHNGLDFTVADGYLYSHEGTSSGPWTTNPNALYISKIGSDDEAVKQEVDFAINACALSVKDGSLIATEKDATEHVLDLMAWEE